MSVKKIAALLGVAVSSVSVWTRDVAPPRPPRPPKRPPNAGRPRTPAVEPDPDGPRRRCSRCDLDLPITAFNRNGDGHQHWCRDCFTEYFRERGDHHREQSRAARARRRARAVSFVLDHLSRRSCVDCGEGELLVLEFDHHRGEKSADVAALVHSGANLERLRNEIERCQVVCVNCHRRRTARRAKTFRFTGTPPDGWPATRVRNARYVVDHLRRSPCVDCGERDPLVLEFDHVGEKRCNVSRMTAWCSLATLEREIAQCEVRCGNCHRLRTASRAGGTWRDPAEWVA